MGFQALIQNIRRNEELHKTTICLEGVCVLAPGVQCPELVSKTYEPPSPDS